MTECKKPAKDAYGTKEWATSNVNCYYGCSNDCRYCYAKKIALRFGRATADSWAKMVPNDDAIRHNYQQRKGRVMFPTTHDITPTSVGNCVRVLRKLLHNGNEVLVTTKPNPACIETLCNELATYRNRMQFRFTITSADNALLNFWEPGAPSLEDRMLGMHIAFADGFKTSVSIEPFLDRDPIPLIRIVRPLATESVWIGPMSQIQRKGLTPEEIPFYEAVRENYTNANLTRIYHAIEEIRRTSSDNDATIRLKFKMRKKLGLVA
jgi:hypothetical protein